MSRFILIWEMLVHGTWLFSFFLLAGAGLEVYAPLSLATVFSDKWLAVTLAAGSSWRLAIITKDLMFLVFGALIIDTSSLGPRYWGTVERTI